LPRTSPLATSAIVAALAGFVCLWGLGGVLAIALGFAAKGAIERSEGRLTGAPLATGAIVLGALNVVLTGLAFAALAAFDFGSSSHASSPATTATVAPAPAPSHALPGPSKPSPRPPRGGAGMSREHGSILTTVGAISLVDLAPEDGLLTKQLAAELETADQAQKQLVLWTVRRDCKPCDGVAAALPDRRMQRALSGVRLVRVDVRDFSVELQRLRVPIQSVPGFSLLGPENRVRDYLHGGEWDEDIPKNIAPVLREFVGGRYIRRRHPWRGGQREDDTPL
jgi:hypothetical protein